MQSIKTIKMKENIEALDRILTDLGLKRVQTGITGQKILIVGIEGNNLDIEIIISWHGEIMLEKFCGNIAINELCKILKELESQIKLLKL